MFYDFIVSMLVEFSHEETPSIYWDDGFYYSWMYLVDSRYYSSKKGC